MSIFLEMWPLYNISREIRYENNSKQYNVMTCNIIEKIGIHIFCEQIKLFLWRCFQLSAITGNNLRGVNWYFLKIMIPFKIP